MALPVFQRTIVTEAGDVIAGAEVEVVNEATGLAADIFSDRAGNTARTNPFFTGADGFAKFFAAPDEYRITATGPTGSIVFRFVVLTGDIATQDANSVNISGGAISSTNLTGGTVNPTTLQQGGSQAYVRNNILGTVSQSAGVPTGAIIQRGSNANGEFVRYADGTQICTKVVTSQQFTTVEFGIVLGTSPIAFINSDYSLTYDVIGGSSNGNFKFFTKRNLLTQTTTTNFGSIEIVEEEKRTSVSTAKIAVIAIGRWF